MEEAATVTEEISVAKTEDSAPTEAPVVTPEVESESETPTSVPMSYLAHINIWHIAEQRLGQAVRSVTVHLHSDHTGEYATLHAFPAEGPVTHQEVSLGRI